MSFVRQFKRFCLLFLAIGAVSCAAEEEVSFDRSWYEKSEQKWLSYFSALGYEGTELRNHVLLVTNTTECAPCLQELAWWNREGRERTNANVSLLVIERHKATFDAFVRVEQIELPAFQDDSASIVERELIPTSPLKLYFDDEGNIAAIDLMGSGGNIPAFLRQIEQE